MDELQIIMAKPMLMATAPLSYLQEILYIWLQQRPPEREWPTVRKLCDALDNDIVEATELAATVRAALTSKLNRYYVGIGQLKMISFLACLYRLNTDMKSRIIQCFYTPHTT